MKALYAVLICLCCEFLVGCTLGPEYTRPDMGLSAAFEEKSAQGEAIANLPWWGVLNDPALQDLIRSALQENRDLLIAAQRIEASRAILGITRADQFPLLDAAGQASRSDSGDEVFQSSAGPRNNFGIFTDLSFELDIWGKLRRATEAQRAELLASEYGYSSVMVSLVSDVASTYFTIRGFDDRLAIASETLKNRKDATQLITARFEKGIVPLLDVNQAQVEEADAAITIVNLERQRALAENALTTLLGRTAHSVVRGVGLQKQAIASQFPAGFPAELLERRPDVRAAEESAKAAVARIGVAKADQYPTFNLLGTIGLQSEEIDDLLSERAFSWGIGGNFLGPLLDFGKSWSRVDFAEAEAQATLHRYEQTVLQAVQEVEDSLVSIRLFDREYALRLVQVEAARNAARLSRARYDEGVTSYIEVLDIERSLFDAELGASSSLENYFISVVRLFKALGGGWIVPPNP